MKYTSAAVALFVTICLSAPGIASAETLGLKMWSPPTSGEALSGFTGASEFTVAIPDPGKIKSGLQFDISYGADGTSDKYKVIRKGSEAFITVDGRGTVLFNLDEAKGQDMGVWDISSWIAPIPIAKDQYMGVGDISSWIAPILSDGRGTVLGTFN